MILTLKSCCTKVILNWIFVILTTRKKEISSWMVDINHWVKAMNLDTIRNCLLSYSIGATFDYFLDKGVISSSTKFEHDYNLRPKLWTKCCFMKENCNF